MTQLISTRVPLLLQQTPEGNAAVIRNRVLSAAATVIVLLVLYHSNNGWGELAGKRPNEGKEIEGQGHIIQSRVAVVAADDGRCSDVGISVLKDGGHAVDAAVATALCLGVVHPMSSGLGGGGFMVVRSAETGQAQAYDFRETAPLAASRNMYEKDPTAKAYGPLSAGVPGELAGIHAAWLQHGRLPWRILFQPSIKLARDGFVVGPYLASILLKQKKKIMADPGLRQVFAPNGRLLKSNDTCYNPKLANTLQEISLNGPVAFYNGTIGESFVRDVQAIGGILTMEDLKEYQVEVKDVIAANLMGYSVLGMPPPSSGTVGLALVLNILDSYETADASKASLSLHRLIESLKHMIALRMNLGDPNFVNVTEVVLSMLSPSEAQLIRQKILDNTTFPSAYYLAEWSQIRDRGTSHFCIVDSERNALSITTTVNYYFGGGVLSPSTGIVLNNEMNDFSTPTETTFDRLPPAPSNFIEPKKKPLSSMTPIIILKGKQLAGVIGGSGGLHITPAVIQVFLNHFILGMEPLAAVQHSRIYHTLIPNRVLYENWTLVDGQHIELAEEKKQFLEERGHALKAITGGAVCQLVVQDLLYPIKKEDDGGLTEEVVHGMLTAVSDPRKGGIPAGV
ncbi:glutathione hydrolase 3-like [Aristolochia californica]|uniref:glutathione hydrolase 3-like n=1 Tax=Aristolochia californica TaxID=171875 RepID=UPI0035DC042B